MSRIATSLYGLACYLVFLGVFLYAIGFIGGFATPMQLDGALTARYRRRWPSISACWDCLPFSTA